MFLSLVEYLSLYTYLSSIKYSNYPRDPKLNNAGIENGWLDIAHTSRGILKKLI